MSLHDDILVPQLEALLHRRLTNDEYMLKTHDMKELIWELESARHPDEAPMEDD